jgi:hypothetical protein
VLDVASTHNQFVTLTPCFHLVQKLDHKKQPGDRWLELVAHHLWTPVWQVWLTQNKDLLGSLEDKKKARNSEVTPRITALRAKQDVLLACNKPNS